MTQSTDFWTTAGAAEDDHWFLGTLATVKAPAARTGGALSVVEFLHPQGFATPQHVHHGADEAFYVLSGSLQGYCGDETWAAGEGAFVWLPREIPHGYRVDDGVPVRTLAITLPGGFDKFVVELGGPAGKHGLPTTFEMPEMATMLAVSAHHDIEILGPPLDVRASRP
jgi:quercetin dioxygenase-like cupin family protein